MNRIVGMVIRAVIDHVHVESCERKTTDSPSSPP